MKKIFRGILLILLVIILLSLGSAIVSKFTSKYELEYETWFDTKNIFGNGEYQQYANNCGELDLYNMKYHCSIINSVTNFVEQDDNIFFKGYIYGLDNNSLEVFAVLDLKTNVIKYYVVNDQFDELLIPHSQQMISEHKLIIIDNFDNFDKEEQNVLKIL